MSNGVIIIEFLWFFVIWIDTCDWTESGLSQVVIPCKVTPHCTGSYTRWQVHHLVDKRVCCAATSCFCRLVTRWSRKIQSPAKPRPISGMADSVYTKHIETGKSVFSNGTQSYVVIESVIYVRYYLQEWKIYKNHDTWIMHITCSSRHL